jgi:hypothetical protein
MSTEFNQQRERLIGRFSDADSERDYFVAAANWAQDIASRPGSILGVVKHNEKRHPEQSLTESKLDAKDPFWFLPDGVYYQGASMLLDTMIGRDSHRALAMQMKSQTVAPDSSELLTSRLAENHRQGLNTLIALGHYALFDVGIFRGLVLGANHDRADIASKGVLLNKLMTMQSYGGIGLINQFRPTASIYFSSPKSQSAKNFGVPPRAEALINSLFMMDLKEALGRGGLELYAAMTGKQIVPIEEDGEVIRYEMPEIPSANYVKGFDQIVGVTIAKSQSGRWGMEIGEVQDLRTLLESKTPEDVVEDIYDQTAEAVESITRIETISPRQTRLAREALEATK